MKKSMLAMSVAAAIGGLGFAGAALAITTPGGATADSLELNTNGIGHQLVVPYFSTQSGNATLLNIVNTDTTNGKLVKVRFRGAGNSDDLYDFQVLMSPGDVWTASVTKDADTGLSKLVTTDATCVVGLGARTAWFGPRCPQGGHGTGHTGCRDGRDHVAAGRLPDPCGAGGR